MNHLTNLYKHKCEQLQEQINNIKKMLSESDTNPAPHNDPGYEGPYQNPDGTWQSPYYPGHPNTFPRFPRPNNKPYIKPNRYDEPIIISPNIGNPWIPTIKPNPDYDPNPTRPNPTPVIPTGVPPKPERPSNPWPPGFDPNNLPQPSEYPQQLPPNWIPHGDRRRDPNYGRSWWDIWW